MMAMHQTLWTVSGLSVEIGTDRRTLAKKLDSLRPVEVKGKSRFYHMADVLAHLEMLDNPEYCKDEIDPHTKEFLSGFVSGFFDEWADPLSGYLWRATKPFPGVNAEHVFLMVKTIWTIQLVTLNRWLYKDETVHETEEELSIRTPCVIESLNNPKELKKAIKALEKTSRVWPHMGESMTLK